MSSKKFVLDGESLTYTTLLEIGKNETCIVELSNEAKERINEARKVIEEFIEKNEVKYGINTGFGNFAEVQISDENLSLLQKNLIRSHAVGVGNPIPVHRARMLLALRINILAKGCSGIRLETVEKLVAALNANCISLIPEKGTVGASGDLAPLAHMALGMMGEGLMYNPKSKKYEDASTVLKENGLSPISLQAKEGLALINGTQFICSLGAEALARAEMLAKQADIIAALSIESLHGTYRAFDARVHLARPHNGQMQVAKRLRNLLVPKKEGHSEIYESHKNCKRVQDAYTFRCIPQVHGVVHDTIEFCKKILNTELNSATDNPMVFTPNFGNSEIEGWNDSIVSGGNFHGEYPAKALDYLAIAVAEIANISERRISRMMDTTTSGLPPFLVKEGGLNSGFMIAHCTAAALASENKVLVHPSSNDTLPTSANKEDHVSMGGFSARKALEVVDNTENVIAIELLCACQALDFSRPKKTTTPLENLHKMVREHVKHYEHDRYMKNDMDMCKQFVENAKVYEIVKDYLE
jgi:histidine ammonia-lyase